MKTLPFTAMVLGLGLPLAGLTGCGGAASDRQTHEVRKQAAEQAEEVQKAAREDAEKAREEYNKAADRVREEVGKTAITGEAVTKEAEKVADDLEATGKAQAEQIKKDAEKTSEEIKDAAEKQIDQIEKQVD